MNIGRANQITDNYGILHNVSDHFSDVQSVSRTILLKICSGNAESWEKLFQYSGDCREAIQKLENGICLDFNSYRPEMVTDEESDWMIILRQTKSLN